MWVYELQFNHAGDVKQALRIPMWVYENLIRFILKSRQIVTNPHVGL